MSEEEKKGKKISSSDESENEVAPIDIGSANSIICEPIEEKKKFVSITFEIPLEREQRLGNINLSKSEDERLSYLLDQLQQFFAERKAQFPLRETSEKISKSPERKLKITYEDQSPSKRFSEYSFHRRSSFRTSGRRSDPFERNDPIDYSSIRDRSRSPVRVCTEPLPSFDSTFDRPLRNIYAIPSTSAGVPAQSEIPELTVAEAESTSPPEMFHSSTMSYSETAHNVHDIAPVSSVLQNVSRHPTVSGRSYAERITIIFQFLLQDLQELKAFLDGFQANPGEPSTSSGNSGSIGDLSAISEHFGTGVESNAAIASRDFLQDTDSSIDASLKALSLKNANDSPSPKRPFSSNPASVKHKKSNGASGKRSPAGKSKKGSSSPSSIPYILKSRINQMDVTDVASELRERNAQDRVCLNNCIFNIDEILSYCRESSSPEEILPRLEKLGGECIGILQKLVTLRQECSFLLKQCHGRYSHEGVTYILKVKLQIAVRYKELLLRLLNQLLIFSNYSHRRKQTQR